jgi:hypothetical protein
LLATGWGLGRAFDSGTFGGISTESGGTGNRYHSPKYVGAPRNDISQPKVKLVEIKRVLEGALVQSGFPSGTLLPSARFRADVSLCNSYRISIL